MLLPTPSVPSHPVVQSGLEKALHRLYLVGGGVTEFRSCQAHYVGSGS